MIDCLCAGIVVADFVGAPVARLPKSGELVLTPSISMATGGCAANVAVDLVKLGVRSAIVGRVGADPAGEFVRRELESAGVETTHLQADPSAQTSATLIINVTGDDRRFIHTLGANSRFDGRELTSEFISGSKVLYLGGLFAMPGLVSQAVVRILRAARAVGVITVVDVVIADATGCAEQLQEILPHTDVFLPNQDEARLLTGLADPLAQARRFREWGVATAVVTAGGDGAVLVDARQTIQAGSFAVEFVDGTGSGDAFVAGYIAGLLRGEAPAECLTWGSALGASCVSQPSATAGVFDRKQLADYLAKHSLSISSSPTTN